MDDLIVIILTLIVAVVGALGQIKKKKNAPQTNSEDESKNDFWSFITEDITENQIERQEPEEQNIQSEPETFAQQVKLLNKKQEEKIQENREFSKYNFKAGNEGKSVLKDNLSANSEDKKQPKKKTKRKARDFSLRKAVIYSEILNRKYH
jgi:hypothetical protein